MKLIGSDRASVIRLLCDVMFRERKNFSLPSAVNHLNAFLEREEVQPMFTHILAQDSQLVMKRGRLKRFRHLRTLPRDTNAERMLTLD